MTEEEPSVQCEVCDEAFESEERLEAHLCTVGLVD
jgi:hypothetical protein